MNKKKEVDKLVRLTVLHNFISKQLTEQKDLIKTIISDDDKVIKGEVHKINILHRSYMKFDSALLREHQPELYASYKTKAIHSIELKPLIDHDEEEQLVAPMSAIMGRKPIAFKAD